MPRAALLTAAAGLWLGLAQATMAGSPNCPSAQAVQPLRLPADATAQRSVQPAAAPGTYSHKLASTPLGWPVRDHWCVWIEPPAEPAGTAAGLRERQWMAAVEAALNPWQELIAIERVMHPEQAQVRIWRRKPPLQRLSDGRTRASNGRAVLQLLLVERKQRWQAEPRVEVLLGTTQGPKGLQATALHELGHAFGLWGHSDDHADAMAIQAGPMPVLRLSARDRQTLRWLQRQGGRLQTPPMPPGTPAAAPPPQQAPRAD